MKIGVNKDFGVSLNSAHYKPDGSPDNEAFRKLVVSRGPKKSADKADFIANNLFGEGKVPFAGINSTNPREFRYYRPDIHVLGKSASEVLPFAFAWWHGGNPLSDPFGPGTAIRPWEGLEKNDLETAKLRARVYFRMMEKLGIGAYCFHDRDIAPVGATEKETVKNIWEVAKVLKEEQTRTGIKLGWGTANLFSHPRYRNGAATSNSPEAFAHAAAQVATAIEVTQFLGGENYVFWGGREGYNYLPHTKLSLEQENLAKLLHMAVEFKKEAGANMQFLIEPKPKEPTLHQYDYSVAAATAFLRERGLAEHFKFNVEVNHAELAGSTVEHELTLAAQSGMLGGVDVNNGAPFTGWDTDHFLTDPIKATKMMLVILENKGIGSGVLNFDAKCRSSSPLPHQLLSSHRASMDTMMLGALAAEELITSGHLAEFKEARYAAWGGKLGQSISSGQHDLASLRKQVLTGKVSGGILRTDVEHLVDEEITRAFLAAGRRPELTV